MPLALALPLALGGSGCVTVSVYQPLTGLQRPVVIDPQAPNFEGARMLIRCLPSEGISRADAQTLCRRAGALFGNQGADVEEDVPTAGGGTYRDEDAARAELIVDLASRKLHQKTAPLLTLLSTMTLTMVPAIDEESFEQEITVRDRDGFLLAKDVFQARFVHYFGAGIWAVNWVLDLIARSDEEDLTGDRAKVDFSRDYYRQLTQVVFNARMRSSVLRQFEPANPPPPPQSAAPSQGTR